MGGAGRTCLLPPDSPQKLRGFTLQALHGLICVDDRSKLQVYTACFPVMIRTVLGTRPVAEQTEGEGLRQKDEKMHSERFIARTALHASRLKISKQALRATPLRCLQAACRNILRNKTQHFASRSKPNGIKDEPASPMSPSESAGEHFGPPIDECRTQRVQLGPGDTRLFSQSPCAEL